MRYLKLFESFDKLYNQITEEDFNDNDIRTNLNFDSKLIQKIELHLNDDYSIKIGNQNNQHTKYLDIIHHDGNSVWEIWQTSDDWFMVSTLYNMDRDDHIGPGQEYFECDTFEGLWQLLKDHDIIRN